MTESKPIPLTQTDRAWVDWLYDHLPHPIRAALGAVDDAQTFEDEEETS